MPVQKKSGNLLNAPRIILTFTKESVMGIKKPILLKNV